MLRGRPLVVLVECPAVFGPLCVSPGDAALFGTAVQGRGVAGCWPGAGISGSTTGARCCCKGGARPAVLPVEVINGVWHSGHCKTERVWL